MSSRRFLIWCAGLGIALAALRSASAHRLDEYLHATRLSIDTNRVGLEIDLTPGVAVASQILGSIDTNGDGTISGPEGDAYARELLRSVALKVDGRAMSVKLMEVSYPPTHDMSLGVGIIRLRAAAEMRASGAGRHQLSFLNTHRPGSSVYLVNALVPANPRIQIGEQRRDSAQHGLTLDYTVIADAPSVRTFALIAGCVLAGRWFLRGRFSPQTISWSAVSQSIIEDEK
jgi:hypothetical protein